MHRHGDGLLRGDGDVSSQLSTAQGSLLSLVLYVFHSVVHSKSPWGHIEALIPVFHSRLQGSTDDRVLTSLRPESNFKLLV